LRNIHVSNIIRQSQSAETQYSPVSENTVQVYINIDSAMSSAPVIGLDSYQCWQYFLQANHLDEILDEEEMHLTTINRS
jgi:hypothetical protein